MASERYRGATLQSNMVLCDEYVALQRSGVAISFPRLLAQTGDITANAESSAWAIKLRSAMNPSNAGVKNLRPVWIVGPEDIVIDHRSGWAYVSSQSRPPGLGALSNTQQGAIFGLDLTQDRPQPINLTDELFARHFSLASLRPSAQADGEAGRAPGQTPLPLVRPHGAFHPAGISFFPGAGSTGRLFVINQRSSTSRTIEVFDVDQGQQLMHVRTVQGDRHLISPNDLVAISAEQFYVTNDHGFSSLPLQFVENLLQKMPHLRYGSIAYFDGQSFTTVGHEISYPNGIAVDRVVGRLYVASCLGESLLYAEWHEEEPARKLSLTGEIPLKCVPDNLEWDAAGNLWVGAHQSFKMLSGYVMGVLPESPSSVVRISHFMLSEPRVEEVWSDDGNQLSSSSVAGVYQRADGRKVLLIGAAFDDHLLIGEFEPGGWP